jgi:signal transduction histidine kinase
VNKDKRHFKAIDKQTDFLTRNLLGVPLFLHETIIGVLEVMNKRSGNFNQNDLHLLESVASFAAIAIENARLHRNVLAERDRVIAAEEQARKELARDLHDGPTQLVASILMSLDFAKQAWVKDRSLIPAEFDNMFSLASRASHQMRTMLFELRPLVLETSGLQPALEVFLERRQKDIGLKPKLTIEVQTNNPNGEMTRFEVKIENTIFAIVQETVNNAIKHAKANNITVSLREDEETIFVTIADDGVGFDVEQVMSNYEQRGSLGMINLQERTEVVGGEINIDAAPGKGARFNIFVPKSPDARSMRRRMVTGSLRLR